MPQRRFYVPPEDISGGRATIKGDQAHHIVSVLRKKPGDTITIFDGKGTECLARIQRIGHDLVVATIERKEAEAKLGRPTVALYAAVPKGRKFDLIVEAATELGADSITPLVTVRTVVKLDDYNISTKLDRWQRITVAAAKQCRRSTLPPINEAMDFPSAVQDLDEKVLPILMRSLGESPSICQVLSGLMAGHKEIRVYVGPEGGFSPEEVEIARNASVHLASLGPNVLRTETAAVASLAVIASFLDWRLEASAPGPALTE